MLMDQHGLVPVSYTHLDVYKRQEKYLSIMHRLPLTTIKSGTFLHLNGRKFRLINGKRKDSV